MSNQLSAIFLLLFLLATTIFLYREKMKFERPIGACLVGWRLICIGAVIFWLAGVGTLCKHLGDADATGGVTIRFADMDIGDHVFFYLLFVGAFVVFLGFAVVFVYPCTKRK
jgi:hypothetical protein